jgi:low affinity Fe/Cu permease
LIRVTKGAKNTLLDLEKLDEKQLEELRLHYERMAKMARGEQIPEQLRHGNNHG